LWAFLIEKSLESHPLELHRDTVKKLLTNLIINTDTIDPDENAKKIAEILADQVFLGTKEATKLVGKIIDGTIIQIIDEHVHLDDSHPDREEATDMCFTQEIDTLIDNILQGLEKEGKIIFKGGPIILEHDKPLKNVIKLVNLFRGFSGKLCWWDKYFQEKGFWYLSELDEKKIKDVIICVGPDYANDDKFKEFYRLTKDQFEMNGINFNFRVLADKKMLKKVHARIIIDEKNAYATPSTRTIAEQFDYVHLLEEKETCAAKGMFNKIWDCAVDISKFWEDIQKAQARG